MEDKLRIMVSKELLATLEKDADSFEFYKASKTINRNDFLNTLILNYSEDYEEKNRSLEDKFKATLSKAGLTDSVIQGLLPSLLADSIANRLGMSETEANKALSLKPTRKSASRIQYINDHLLQGISLSAYFRNLFASYARLSPEKREMILAKEQVSELTEAIEAKKTVYLVTKRKHRMAMDDAFAFAPYAIASSPEELHSYVLGVRGGMAATLRLSSIQSVQIEPEPAAFAPDQLSLFQRMAKYGPQYTYRPGEKTAIVFLTKNGQKLFSRLYVYRPIPDRVENGYYWFSCSQMQLFQYFQRFGPEALVLEPEPLRARLTAFYAQSKLAYETIDPKAFSYPRQANGLRIPPGFLRYSR